MARYFVIPEKDLDGKETGRYLVVDRDGNIVAGPFDSSEEAREWIIENDKPFDPERPPQVPDSPSPGF